MIKAHYRWAADLRNELVFEERDDLSARNLQAATLEHTDHHVEPGIWRNIFVAGAQKPHDGVDASAFVNTSTPDVLFNIGVGMTLDFLGVKFKLA